MIAFLSKPPRSFLIFECAALFLITPLILYTCPSRLNVHLSLWAIAAYAVFVLSNMPNFSWAKAWRGRPWEPRDLKMVIARFTASTVGIILLTYLIKPDRLFLFPVQRPIFWLMVMVLYPLLSAVPQELVFRTFFFHRYNTLFPRNWMMLVSGALIFGFIHIVFHNPVSPVLSVLCGFFLTSSYIRHASLKKVSIEHALYGDMVFTVGLGFYFLVQSF